jgi:hypothetical protein
VVSLFEVIVDPLKCQPTSSASCASFSSTVISSTAVHQSGADFWYVISQERITAFADCTEDWQFILVAPERAAHSRSEGTIAHGFLTLPMLAPKLGGSIWRFN